MPKLNEEMANEAEVAIEEGGPEPIPAGVYVGKLTNVTVSDKPGGSGFHYWVWEFQVMDEGYTNKTLKTNTSLSPQARFSFGGMFKAFGVPANTHTDELIGQRVLMTVTQVPIQKGPRTGQITNNVEYCSPFSTDEAPASFNTNHDEDF